jgi:hypothetical protein
MIDDLQIEELQLDDLGMSADLKIEVNLDLSFFECKMNIDGRLELELTAEQETKIRALIGKRVQNFVQNRIKEQLKDADMRYIHNIRRLEELRKQGVRV